MKKAEVEKVVQPVSLAADVGRRAVLRGMLGLGGALVLGACGTGSDGSTSPRPTGVRVSARWLGGGVMEFATPDYKQIAYADAWIWNNAGWTRFGVQKPPEYATKEGFVQYVTGKKPEAVFVLLTHDHGDQSATTSRCWRRSARRACRS